MQKTFLFPISADLRFQIQGEYFFDSFLLIATFKTRAIHILCYFHFGEVLLWGCRSRATPNAIINTVQINLWVICVNGAHEQFFFFRVICYTSWMITINFLDSLESFSQASAHIVIRRFKLVNVFIGTPFECVIHALCESSNVQAILHVWHINQLRVIRKMGEEGRNETKKTPNQQIHNNRKRNPKNCSIGTRANSVFTVTHPNIQTHKLDIQFELRASR